MSGTTPKSSRVPTSAAALSNAEPTRPIDWVTPSASHARANRSPTYSPPLSRWKITPATSPPRTAGGHAQRRLRHRRVVVLAHREPREPPGGQVQHRGQV